jgi:hypothetical protein
MEIKNINKLQDDDVPTKTSYAKYFYFILMIIVFVLAIVLAVTLAVLL